MNTIREKKDSFVNLYDIKGGAYQLPKNPELEKAKLNGVTYTPEDNIVFNKAEKHVEDLINRHYEVKDSLEKVKGSTRKEHGLEALE